MLELITKIRSRKWLFLLLIAPLIFTPIYSFEGGNRYYQGLTIGPQIAIPLDFVGGGHANVGYWTSGRLPYDFDLTAWLPPSHYFIDWGRIAYWELWVLLTYFCIVPWCRTQWPRFKNWWAWWWGIKQYEENKQKESE